MPSNDLETQLNIQNSINDTLRERVALSDAQASSFEGQVNLTQEIFDALGPVGDLFEDLTNSISSMVQVIKNLFSATVAMFKFTAQTLLAPFKLAGKIILAPFQLAYKGVKLLVTSFIGLGKMMLAPFTYLGKKLLKMGKLWGKIMLIPFQLAYKGVKLLLTPLVGLGKMMLAPFAYLGKKISKIIPAFGVLKIATLGIMQGLWSVGSSLYGYYDKFYKWLVKKSIEAAREQRKISTEWQTQRDAVGDLTTGIGLEIKDAVKEFGKESKINTGRFFGWGADATIEEIKRVSTAVLSLGHKALGPLRSQLVSSSEALFHLKEGAGLSDEALQSLGSRALGTGKNLQDVMNEAMSGIATMANEFNVSTKSLGKNFDAIAKDVSNFGHLTVKEMTALSGVMTKTGISMKSLQGVATQFDTFSSGAESVAKLTQAFGMQLSAVDLLNASEAERTSMIKESFLATGRSIEGLGRQERAYLAQNTGFDVDDLENIFGDQAASIDEAAEAAERAQQAQMDSTAAMKEMAASIKTIFKPIQDFTGAFDAFFKGFKTGSELGSKTITDLYDDLAKIEDIGARFGKTFANIFDESGFMDWFSLDDTIKHLTEFEEIIDRNFGKTSEGSFLDKIKKSFTEIEKYIGPYIKDAFEEITNFLTSDEFVQTFSDAFWYLWEQIESIWKVIKLKFGPMVERVFGQIVDYLENVDWHALFESIADTWSRELQLLDQVVKYISVKVFGQIWKYLTSDEFVNPILDAFKSLLMKIALVLLTTTGGAMMGALAGPAGMLAGGAVGGWLGMWALQYFSDEEEKLKLAKQRSIIAKENAELIAANHEDMLTQLTFPTCPDETYDEFPTSMLETNPTTAQSVIEADLSASLRDSTIVKDHAELIIANLDAAKTLMGSGETGALAVAKAMVAEQKLVMDELRKLGEGGIDLAATIDNINQGITANRTEVQLDTQKVNININLCVNLEANALAKALSDQNIVDQKYTLVRSSMPI